MDSIKDIQDKIKGNTRNAREKLGDTKVKMEKLKVETTGCLDEIKGQTGMLGSELKEIKSGFEKSGGKADPAAVKKTDSQVKAGRKSGGSDRK